MKQHAMKQNELDLLHRYLDGAITPEEFESLEDVLRSSAEARTTLRSLATIDAKWQQLSAEGVVATPNDRMTVSRMTGRAIPLWLTLCAIAASVIFGAFGWFRAPQQRQRGRRPSGRPDLRR